MSASIPVYDDGSGPHRADTCRPLVEAAAAGRLSLVAYRHGHYPGPRLPRKLLAGLKMIGFWDADQDQDWGLDWHYNEGLEITFLENGGLPFSVDEREYDLKPDDLTITRPWQRHRVGRPYVQVSRLHWLILDVGVRRPHEPWKWPDWILLTPSDRTELTNLLRENEHPVWSATPDIRRCFRLLSKAVEEGNFSSVYIRINEVLALILELQKGKQIGRQPWLRTAQRTVHLFLDQLQADPERLSFSWSLESMAQHCGLGVTQFVEHVKRITNTTPMDHLTQCRLERAALLLRQQADRTVLDIALDCGFSSSQYFATLFRDRFGCTPREFRRTSSGIEPPHAGGSSRAPNVRNPSLDGFPKTHLAGSR